MKDNNKKASPWKSIQLGLAVLAGLLIYAYGFQITRVDLEDLRSERRQESLARVMRALAQPEIFEYEQTEEVINSPVYVPCPANGVHHCREPDKSGPYLVITPACAAPGETVQVEGFNFAPNTDGPLALCPRQVTQPTWLRLGVITWKPMMTGTSSLTWTLPKRPSDDVQYIRATLRRNVGTPHFTKNRARHLGKNRRDRFPGACWQPPLAPSLPFRLVSLPPVT